MEEFLDSIDEANRKCSEIVLMVKKMAVLIRLPKEVFETCLQTLEDDVQPEFVVQKEEDSK